MQRLSNPRSVLSAVSCIFFLEFQGGATYRIFIRSKVYSCLPRLQFNTLILLYQECTTSYTPPPPPLHQQLSSIYIYNVGCLHACMAPVLNLHVNRFSFILLLINAWPDSLVNEQRVSCLPWINCLYYITMNCSIAQSCVHALSVFHICIVYWHARFEVV